MKNFIKVIDIGRKFDPYHEIEGLVEGGIDEVANVFSGALIGNLMKYDWYTQHKISKDVVAIGYDEVERFPLDTLSVEDYLGFLNDVLEAARGVKERHLAIFEPSTGYVIDPRRVASIKKLEEYGAAVSDTDNIYDVLIGLPEEHSVEDETQYWEPKEAKSKPTAARKWWRFW
ncbi:hypothetical protein LZP73_13115 [Shewanella sp. AS16]|uniref:hypothetical protein n=1 Tax=Shewanella sp. AS16 TaxID=2907625 RepID=UPI001F272FE0|nr:hypothetical protein [Shewanella sp. AS16]MCE9687132.1 hypothetical protein [Shewanella sp. AS16]